jgi:flagellar protein FliO/FliZ
VKPAPLSVRPRLRCCAARLAALLAAALAAPLSAFAADAAPTPGVSLATTLQAFAGLALILGLFIGAAWLLRRMNGGSFMAGHGPLRTICSLPVGARERIVLVEIEDTWLVVGVAPGEVRTLHVMPKGAIAKETPADNQFGQWLKQFREPRHDSRP